MKKLIYGTAVALLIAASSCGDSKSTEGSKFFSAEATDSIVNALGQYVGSQINSELTRRMEKDSTVMKAEFLRGMQYGFATDTASLYVEGVRVGLQMQEWLKQYREMGLNVNSDVLLAAIKSAVLSDSVPSRIDVSLLESKWRMWNDSLVSAHDKYEQGRLAATPQAQENLEKSINYIKTLAAMNDSVKLTPSGVGIKVITPGTGATVNPDQPVKLIYTGKTLSGATVEKNPGTVTNLNKRTQGFREGVATLSKGAKAVIYVPGNLAHGVDYPKGMPIGPNELVIYEVEVVDIPTPTNN